MYYAEAGLFRILNYTQLLIYMHILTSKTNNRLLIYHIT